METTRASASERASSREGRSRRLPLLFLFARQGRDARAKRISRETPTRAKPRDAANTSSSSKPARARPSRAAITRSRVFRLVGARPTRPPRTRARSSRLSMSLTSSSSAIVAACALTRASDRRSSRSASLPDGGNGDDETVLSPPKRDARDAGVRKPEPEPGSRPTTRAGVAGRLRVPLRDGDGDGGSPARSRPRSRPRREIHLLLLLRFSSSPPPPRRRVGQDLVHVATRERHLASVEHRVVRSVRVPAPHLGYGPRRVEEGGRGREQVAVAAEAPLDGGRDVQAAAVIGRRGMADGGSDLVARDAVVHGDVRGVVAHGDDLVVGLGVPGGEDAVRDVRLGGVGVEVVSVHGAVVVASRLGAHRAGRRGGQVDRRATHRVEDRANLLVHRGAVEVVGGGVVNRGRGGPGSRGVTRGVLRGVLPSRDDGGHRLPARGVAGGPNPG